MTVLISVYHDKVVETLRPFSEKLRDLPGADLIRVDRSAFEWLCTLIADSHKSSSKAAHPCYEMIVVVPDCEHD